MKSRTPTRPKDMALKKKNNTSRIFTDHTKVLDLENDVKKNSCMTTSNVKPQNCCFNQYVEKMHNDYWLKRKCLLQKYHSFSNVTIQLSPSQLNKRLCSLLCSYQPFEKSQSPSSSNIKRGNDILNEQYGRLALKKKIKRRKDRDTLPCNKIFHQHGSGEYNCDINRRNRVVSTCA